jgi:hypothetical protein
LAQAIVVACVEVGYANKREAIEAMMEEVVMEEVGVVRER